MSSTNLGKIWVVKVMIQIHEIMVSSSFSLGAINVGNYLCQKYELFISGLLHGLEVWVLLALK